MSENRKKEIIMATLQLASEKGLGAVSMSMIAEKVGIKKPSLYNHFKSKDELIEEMYQFLRNNAIEKTNTKVANLDILTANKSAEEILINMVDNYVKMNSEQDIQMFYKVVYSERTISSKIAKILVEETEKMIYATEQLFKFLQDKKLLYFSDLKISALSFALTIHGLMDYEADKSFSENEIVIRNKKLIYDYVSNFCKEHSLKEK